MKPHRATRFLGTALLALASACATDQAVREQANDYHRELEPAILKDAELKTYFTDIGARIVAAARSMHEQGLGPEKHFEGDEDWMFSKGEFHLVNSDTLNAFTTGGEHAYIYSQLMRECANEDELAAVMAHEYGHVYARHVHKGMDRRWGVLGTAIVLGGVGYAAGGEEHGAEYAAYGAGLGMIAGNFLMMGFTREDEAEADQLGFDIYVRAGWDPQRFAGFFQTLIDQGHDTQPEIASDHPSLASRVAAAKKRAAALPPSAAEWRKPPVADEARYEGLKLRAAAVGQTMPDDQSLARAKLLLAAVPSCLLPEDTAEQKQARAVLEAAHADSQAGAAPK